MFAVVTFVGTGIGICGAIIGAYLGYKVFNAWWGAIIGIAVGFIGGINLLLVALSKL